MRFNVAVPARKVRLKGKARKLEGATTKQNLTADTLQVQPRHFQILATAIANSKNVSVLHEVHTVLRSIVHGRKECRDWYRWRPDLHHEDDDMGHKHFLSVLQEVLIILKLKERPLERQPSENLRSKHNKNSFQELAFEDIIDMEEIPTAIPSTGNKVVRYEVKDMEQEIALAVHCFLKNATTLRAYIRRTWREFAQSKIGLQAAGQTMNAAIAMIKGLSDDLKAAFPQFEGRRGFSMHQKITDFVYTGCEREKDCGRVFIRPEHEDSIMSSMQDSKIFTPRTMLCVRAMDLLTFYCMTEKSAISPEGFRSMSTYQCFEQATTPKHVPMYTKSYFYFLAYLGDWFDGSRMLVSHRSCDL